MSSRFPLLALVLLAAGPVRAQETGGELGTPPSEGGSPASEVPTTSVDPTVVAPERPQTDPPANTLPVDPSNEEIPAPPRGSYTVPSGYGNNPRPTFVSTQPSFRPSVAPQRRVRVRVREGAQIPADARIFERRSKFLLLPGIIAFGVSYAISLSAGILDEDRLLYAPLVGPLLWQLDEGTSDTAGLMVLLTLAQTAGVLLFSFGMRKKKYAEWYAGGRRISLAAAPSRRGAALTLNVW